MSLSIAQSENSGLTSGSKPIAALSMEIQDNEILTLEQQALLKCLELKAQEMSREQLIIELQSAWRHKMVQSQMFLDMTQQVGIPFKMREDVCPKQPSTEEEMIEIFGHIPTEEEYMTYLTERHEDATGILDMEAIVMEAELEWRIKKK